MAKQILTQARLKELLHYDPDTGIFTWKARSGKVAGTNSRGYIVICIDYKLVRAHRLAFLYMTGSLPTALVDHKDRVKTNNSWGNLRLSDKTLNGQNVTSAKKNSKTGILGVSWSKQHSKYEARIRIPKGKYAHLGLFNCIEKAEHAYLAAKRKYHEGFNQ